MSLFLGPIHYNLFSKIKNLKEITDKLINHFNLDETNYATQIDFNQDLANLIDEMNIHGWLLNALNEVEDRHALVLNNILKTNTIDIVTKFYFELGLNENKVFKNVADAFSYITSTMLDGMPCDRGLNIINQDDEEIVFEINPNVHSSLISFDLFQNLRHSYINGLLNQSNKLKLIKLNETTYLLKEE